MRRFYYFLIFTAVITGLFVIWQGVEVVNYGYLISNLRREIKFLKEENSMLKLEYMELTSLSKVEDVAFNQLGMVYPEDRIYISYCDGRDKF